uniref:Uncharacterized protein n=1 Tax=Arundo donax TaxID=35708 RepID=A0A0A8Z3F9_ARUDO
MMLCVAPVSTRILMVAL